MDKEGIDDNRRQFLVSTTTLLGLIGIGAASVPFASSWWPSARAKALGAPVEVDLSKMEPGQMVVVEWRGKPVWIVKRTQAMLEKLDTPNSNLRDPDSKVEQQPDYAKNQYRSINPVYLVLIGICTHLGCSPKYKPTLGELGPNWPGGFYCPCHGSTFDLAGRVFKGVPAPINLEVPPHHYIKQDVLVIGEDKS